MKFEGVTGVTQPKAPPRVSAVQAQYDKAIEPEGDVKSMKTRLRGAQVMTYGSSISATLSLDGDKAEALARTYTFHDTVFVVVDFAVGLNRVSLSGQPDEIHDLLTAAALAVEQATFTAARQPGALPLLVQP